MGLLQDSILLAPDTLANLPAAATVPIGAIYCVTDSAPANQLFRNNGASWDAYSPSGGGGATSVTAAGTLTSGQPVLGAGSKTVAVGPINLAGGASFVSGDLPFANLTQGSALSVLGVTGNATADNASIAAGSDHQVLRRSGTAVAFGAVNLAQAAAITGTLPVANGGTGITTAAQIRVASVPLTNAQIKALAHPTDVTLLAAPGAGFRNRVLAVTFVGDFNAAAYTNINATFASLQIFTGASTVVYGPFNDSTSTPALTDFSAFFGNNWSPVIDMPPLLGLAISAGGYIYSSGVVYDTTAQDNAATILNIDNNGSSDLTGGNAANTLTVILYYTIEAV